MKWSLFNKFIVVACLILAPFGGREEALSQWAYKEIEVRNGGTITGVIRLSGGEPNIATLEIVKDSDFCGRKKPSPRFEVGKNRGVKNAVVFLESITEGKKLGASRPVILDQQKCVYQPHVAVVPPKSQLEIVNSDAVLHNVHAYHSEGVGRTVFNIAQPIKGQRTPIISTLFKSPGIYHATCDAGHPWMSAYVVVAEHPYYALSDANGKFSLEDIPAGSYNVKMWHEGVHVVRTELENGKPKKYHFEEPYEFVKEITIPADGKVEVDFEFSLRDPLASE